MTADARHERELRRDAWIRGGDEREATREAEAEQAHAIALDVVLASAEIRDRVSDHGDSTRGDAVVGEVVELGREDDVPGAGERAGEGDESFLVDAQVVDAVRDHDAASHGSIAKEIQPRANRSVQRGDTHLLLDDVRPGLRRLGRRRFGGRGGKLAQKLHGPRPAGDRRGGERGERGGQQGHEEPELPLRPLHFPTLAPNSSPAPRPDN